MKKKIPGVNKEELVQRYATVFSGELGTLEGEVHTDLDATCRPLKMPLRRVPLAVQDK